MNWFLLLLILVGFLHAEELPIACSIKEGRFTVREIPPGMIQRNYVFDYSGQEYSFLLDVDEVTLLNLSQVDQAARNDLALMVRRAAWELTLVSNRIQEFADSRDWDRTQTVEFTLRFVQSLPYKTDFETTGEEEFFRCPTESIADIAVDCEDSSILLAGLLWGLKYEFVFISPPGHLAVGIQGDYEGWYVQPAGRRFFYAETTGFALAIGEIGQLADRQVIVFDISGQVQQGHPAVLRLEGGAGGKPNGGGSWMIAILILLGVVAAAAVVFSMLSNSGPKGDYTDERVHISQTDDEVMRDEVRKRSTEL